MTYVHIQKEAQYKPHETSTFVVVTINRNVEKQKKKKKKDCKFHRRVPKIATERAVRNMTKKIR
jgi:hypothetical protein